MALHVPIIGNPPNTEQSEWHDWFVSCYKTLTRQQLDNLLDFFFESNLEYPIGFVDYEALQVLVQEVGCVLQVIQQTAGSRHQYVNTCTNIVYYV